MPGSVWNALKRHNEHKQDKKDKKDKKAKKDKSKKKDKSSKKGEEEQQEGAMLGPSAAPGTLRASKLSAAHPLIERRFTEALAKGEICAPTASWCKQLREECIAAGVLSADSTPEGIRAHLLKYANALRTK